MNSTIYLSCQFVVVLMIAAILSTILKSLKFVFQKMRIKKERKHLLLLFIGIGLICWLAILITLSYLNVFSDFSSFPPKVFLVIFPPLLLIFYLLFFSRLFKTVLKTLPKSWLIYGQSFRIILELMLWLGFLGGFVPMQMTFEWLNQDIIVGVTALMGGYFFFWRGRYMRFEAIIWNVFGMLLLFNIMLLSIFSMPSPFRVFLNEPANIFLTNIPFIWIPGFLVPFALALHLFSLRQLILDTGRKNRRFSLQRKTH